jgi:hypothetical protein
MIPSPLWPWDERAAGAPPVALRRARGQNSPGRGLGQDVSESVGWMRLRRIDGRAVGAIHRSRRSRRRELPLPEVMGLAAWARFRRSTIVL